MRGGSVELIVSSLFTGFNRVLKILCCFLATGHFSIIDVINTIEARRYSYVGAVKFIGFSGLFILGYGLDMSSEPERLLKPSLGHGSIAPSLGGLNVDGSPVPLGPTTTHDPTGISESPSARWKSQVRLRKTLK
jgi:hypothetical protein